LKGLFLASSLREGKVVFRVGRVKAVNLQKKKLSTENDKPINN
jgi:hypothetical protein